MTDHLLAAFAPLRAALEAERWPGAEAGTSWGKPALLCRGKFFAGVKDPDTYVLYVPLEEKELLFQAAPEIYWETPHYTGWPALLVRAAAISEVELRHRLERAWRMRAGKRQIAELEARRSGAPPAPAPAPAARPAGPRPRRRTGA